MPILKHVKPTSPFARIRTRLAAWNLLVMSFLVVGAIGSAIFNEVQSHDEAIEQELRLVATRVSMQFDGHQGSDVDSFLQKEHEIGISELASDLIIFIARPSKPVWQAWGHGARSVSPDEAAIASAFQGRESVSNGLFHDEPIRFLSVPIRDGSQIVGVVQVGRPFASNRRARDRSIVLLLSTGALGLLLSVLGSFFLASRAIGPIQAIFERQRKFVADVSHALRTPVAALRARASLLSGRDASSLPVAGEDVEKLRHDAEELDALLVDLLDISRLDSGTEELLLSPVALSSTAAAVVEAMEPLAKERGVELSFASMPLWAQANRMRIQQLLRALLDNALKHTPRGGHIRVAITLEGIFARIRVTDDGEGISKEHLPRVFERFYRVDSELSRGHHPAGSAGLGLAIVAELVGKMAGEVRIESDVGRGTTVTILLPMAQES